MNIKEKAEEIVCNEWTYDSGMDQDAAEQAEHRNIELMEKVLTEIRNETLEEAAKVADRADRYSMKGYDCAMCVADDIRKLKVKP